MLLSLYIELLKLHIHTFRVGAVSDLILIKISWKKYQWGLGKHLVLSCHPHSFPGIEDLFILQVQKKNNIQVFTRNIQYCSSCTIFIRASDTVSFHKNKFIPYASKISITAQGIDSFCSSCCLQLYFLRTEVKGELLSLLQSPKHATGKALF